MYVFNNHTSESRLGSPAPFLILYPFRLKKLIQSVGQKKKATGVRPFVGSCLLPRTSAADLRCAFVCATVRRFVKKRFFNPTVQGYIILEEKGKR